MQEIIKIYVLNQEIMKIFIIKILKILLFDWLRAKSIYTNNNKMVLLLA